MNRFIILTIMLSSLNANLLSCESSLKADVTKVITAIANNDLDTVKAVYAGHEHVISLTRDIIKQIGHGTTMSPETGTFMIARVQELKTAYTSLKHSRPDYKGPVLEWPTLGVLFDPLVDTDGRCLNKYGKRMATSSVFDTEWSAINTQAAATRK